MNTLEIISKYDRDWRNIVTSFGGYDFVDDVVQNFYLKIYNNNIQKVLIEDKPNKVYCWVMLRTLYFDELKKQKSYIDIEECKDICEDTYDYQTYVKELSENVMKDLPHFDQELWHLYTQSDLSMRDIAKGTKISLRTIFTSLKITKEKIKEELWQEENQKV